MKKIFGILVFTVVVTLVFATTIYDIQYTTNAGPDGWYPSPLVDEEVTVTGIVTGANFNNDNKFFMSDPEGGAWHGIYVYDYVVGPAVGDEVEVTGTVTEYYGLTMLGYCTINILSSGNTVPAPVLVQTANLVNPATAEQYEGCLIEVNNVTVTESQNDYGEWYIDDGSGECQVDDGFFYLDEVVPEIVITVGMEWAIIRGCLDHSYDEFGINPRTPDDLINEFNLDADFIAEPVSGIAPLQVQFADISVIYQNPIISWQWDFDNDGFIDSNEQNPTYIYSIEGFYTVSLTVSDSINTDTEIKVDYITVGNPVIADFSADPLFGLTPVNVQFTDLSIGGFDIILWEWDFENDGTIDSYEQNPNHTYSEEGVYTVQLTVNDGTFSDTETKVNYISIGDPINADFEADPLEGIQPLEVHFTDLSTGGLPESIDQSAKMKNPNQDNSRDIISWEWDFNNDGIIDSYSQNPIITYTQIDIYSITLIVSDGTFEDTITKEDYITVLGIIDANFTGSPLNGNNPLEVNFTDLSTGNPTSWLWDFDNDGFVDSNEQNPNYIFDEVGIYTVSLTVSNGTDTDTEIKEDFITVNSVSSDIGLLPIITKLYQNHPNPFNPLTIIRFDIKENETGTLKIFNIRGQIIESHQFESGKHNYLWDASGQASGIYLYKLENESLIETRKMLLLK